LEELLYWGAILGFYLWSAYRSNKKKAERLMPPQTPPKKEVENPQIPNNQKINILDFLNKAFEESVSTPVKNTQNVLPNKKDHSTENTFVDHFDSKHDLSAIDDRHLGNFQTNDQHLKKIVSRLDSKEQSSTNKKSNTLALVQEKYRKNPTEVGIIMQAIFEPPKAMQ
jgi:hypothetical protein